MGIWFNFDLAGVGLISATWLFLVFAACVTNHFIIFHHLAGKNDVIPRLPLTVVGLVVFALYIFLLVMAFLSHFAAIFTDPGVVRDFVPPEGRKTRFCKKCKIFKPDRAHHCKTCNRCIFRMDHHCPWVNNCVGFRNQRLFILFLLYVATLSVYSIGLVLYVCFTWYTAERNMSYTNTSIVCGVLLVIESGFFLFFVGDFLSEQLESIETNSTLVETYQRKRGRKMGFYPQLEEVMGRRWLLWWVPIPNPIPADYLEETYEDDTAPHPAPGEPPMDVAEIGVDADDQSPPKPHKYDQKGESESTERNESPSNHIISGSGVTPEEVRRRLLTQQAGEGGPPKNNVTEF